MFGFRHHPGRNQARWRRLADPWLRQPPFEEDRAGQPYRAEHVGKHVHRRRPLRDLPARGSTNPSGAPCLLRMNWREQKAHRRTPGRSSKKTRGSDMGPWAAQLYELDVASGFAPGAIGINGGASCKQKRSPSSARLFVAPLSGVSIPNTTPPANSTMARSTNTRC